MMVSKLCFLFFCLFDAMILFRLLRVCRNLPVLHAMNEFFVIVTLIGFLCLRLHLEQLADSLFCPRLFPLNQYTEAYEPA